MSIHDAKPAIWISSDLPEHQCQSIWQHLLLGIEEEGIPWKLQQSSNEQYDDITEQAWQAATKSPLLVGLACRQHEVVLHYRHLPTTQPLFRFVGSDRSSLLHRQLPKYSLAEIEELRRLGNNAARLVKGQPFKF